MKYKDLQCEYCSSQRIALDIGIAPITYSMRMCTEPVYIQGQSHNVEILCSHLLKGAALKRKNLGSKFLSLRVVSILKRNPLNNTV